MVEQTTASAAKAFEMQTSDTQAEWFTHPLKDLEFIIEDAREAQQYIIIQDLHGETGTFFTY